MIHHKLRQQYPMDEEQRDIISHKEGPLLVIAGPGSGKTHSLTLLAMNLLLCSDAEPSQLILCTYTEKAAHEMQDRLASIAKEVDYGKDLSQLKIGTIHGLCNQFVTEYLHHTSLGNNYEILNQFTQPLLVFEHIDEICSSRALTFFQERWGTQWQVAKKLCSFFDKIVEELIFDELKAAIPRIKPSYGEREAFLYFLTLAYKEYQKLLHRTNRIDFAHLQKCVYNLLQDEYVYQRITSGTRYILVDEYQDTNYIQEQILLSLARATGKNNLCVVGDEDQALYRFRGATVRNILEFANNKFPECKQLHLTTNYRSHPDIINFYNHWMQSLDWSNGTEHSLSRTNKTIRADPLGKHPAYPSVLSLLEVDVHQEAEQLADIIFALKAQGQINDYNQVALLLHNVRSHMSNAYIEAFQRRGIPVFCPRARTYFDQEEVRLIIGCFARILGYHKTKQDIPIENGRLPEYTRECIQYLQRFPALEQELEAIEHEIAQATEEADIPGKQLLDYFYRLIFNEAFAKFQANKNPLSNLVIFSQLLTTFQNYYHHSGITQSTLPGIKVQFFHTFFYLLYEDGANLYEDPKQPFPPGHVQIMTIHQAKGLEFPIIITGRLDKPSTPSRDESKNENKYLQSFYQRKPFEAEARIPAFDLRRLYYVAFSRAKRLLILTANKKPYKEFTQIWQEAPDCSYAYDSLRTMPPSDKIEPYISPKPRYSFTNHIQMYATCPRRFQYFREFNFVPRHSSEPFTGLLVHQTLERIHRIVLDRKLHTLNDASIKKIFDSIFTFLAYTSMVSIDELKKEKALRQVLNYFHSNQKELSMITAAESNFQVEKENYILTGKIDLLIQGKNGLEIMDFKTRTRPENNSEYLTFYKQQLYLYAYAMEKRTGLLPKRLFLYWTAEEQKKDALMEVPYTSRHIKQVSAYVDDIVACITQQRFEIESPPNPEICQTCDIRHLCRKEGIL